jgi:AcrR family transcriptional regulator
VFDSGGASASTEEVARLAGVGIGTVFRHFPTKASLLEAVLVGRFDHLREHADRLRDAPDPRTALFGFFSYMVADATTKIAIADALAAVGGQPSGPASQASDRLQVAVGALLARAQDVGAVRNDIHLPEFYMLLVGACRAAALVPPNEGIQARTLAVIFDGLCPSSRGVAEDVPAGAGRCGGGDGRP